MTEDICVIVPTIREHECLRAYVENAREHGFDASRLHAVLVTGEFRDVDAMEAMLDKEGISDAVFDASATFD